MKQNITFEEYFNEALTPNGAMGLAGEFRYWLQVEHGEVYYEYPVEKWGKLFTKFLDFRNYTPNYRVIRIEYPNGKVVTEYRTWDLLTLLTQVNKWNRMFTSKTTVIT